MADAVADAAAVETARSRFHAALDAQPDGPDDPLLPSRLAQAASEALGADGASLTVALAELRVPLGASSPEAALAESLQFTEGAGPCLEAMRAGHRVDVPAAELERRWERLAARWRDETPFRSAVSAPVPMRGITASVDLYMDHEDDGANLPEGVVDAVARLVGEKLEGEFADASSGQAMSRRAEVWTAIGMVIGETGESPADALAYLRRLCVDQGELLDDVAHRLLTGDVSLDDLAS